MSYEVVYTDHFERELKRLFKKHRSIKSDIEALIASLEQEPFQGDNLGQHCYKIRMAISSKGKGKSGGSRVITHVYVARNIVYLLSIYDKSERADISDKELMLLLKGIR